MAERQGRRVLLAGGTGTIGAATARALLRAGHEVVALARPGRAGALPLGVEPVEADVAEPSSLRAVGRFDAVISCLASRTGAPAEAWAIEHRAQSNLLALAREAGAAPFVLLSAICVQKPLLEFQKAKLAFEGELRESGVAYAIVRPTAFFKSLSGQAERVRAGKPFLLFGDGALTACKPISDDDLARYLVRCLTDASLQGRILPIGGPGPALTPRQQGEALFAAFGMEPRFRHVPVRMMDAIIGGLSLGGWVSRAMADKAEFARIGRYYATESMLVFDPRTGRYDADATPETGNETLPDFYRRLAAGEATVDLGAHAVF
ncbi:NAD-dependent epimerase/dehydratase family protein [Rhodovulum sp. 12E13]|uniref:NAD(P)H-binding protein n=1 Tax=Rhodovulum sp. 12E13 TaxID=2203891 RepID=UPI000E139ED0|nr:NAD(P)H-binding protein [Rhodovulum sp. 12E13]RDC69810.1 NAD-dependent epimerase/dehydratase family protein [Rhodovulum sp. 12E13]